MAKMQFCLTDKEGELFVVGEVNVNRGMISQATTGLELLKNVRTHEMSGFKIVKDEERK